MREIKFRAYDKKNKKWLHGYGYDREGCSMWGEVILTGSWLSEVKLEDLNDIEIQQYTGLKDKKGVEIYEGDILIFTKKNFANGEKNAYSNDPVAVKFSRGDFVCYNPNCCDICKDSMGCISTLDEALCVGEGGEVVGNIYEHPELLEVKE
jgi:uncharacterized phage protein (TIGR01671 family)